MDTSTSERHTNHNDRHFDASKYLTKLKGRDYLEVKWRLLWLRTEHPDAVVETELVEHDREKRWCMFKAKVSFLAYGPGDRSFWASATGYGQEDAAGFAGNPGDYPEKAETKALGRALAALGYGTQFTEDHEELVVDSPVDRAPKAQPRQAAATPAPSASAGTEQTAGPGTLTGDKTPEGLNILTVEGVRCTKHQTSQGRVYYQTLPSNSCDAHGSPWYRQVQASGELAPTWTHKTKSGDTCTMALPGKGA